MADEARSLLGGSPASSPVLGGRGRVSSSSSSSSSSSAIPPGHSFRRVTLTKPTFCHYCTDFIWGLAGYLCEGKGGRGCPPGGAVGRRGALAARRRRCHACRHGVSGAPRRCSAPIATRRAVLAGPPRVRLCLKNPPNSSRMRVALAGIWGVFLVGEAHPTGGCSPRLRAGPPAIKPRF